MAKYAWRIEKVRDEDLQDEVGTEGPRRFEEKLLDIHPTRFRMYDDDWKFSKEQGETPWAYEGILGGDYEGFEPLDDFGMPNYGCTGLAVLYTEKPDESQLALIMEKDKAGWWVML